MDAVFVTSHYVSAEYHKNHPQLIHKHADDIELLYFIDGEGEYIVAGKAYYVVPGSLVICNAGVMHGEAPVQKLEKESYCCVLKEVHYEDLPANTLTRPGENPILVFSGRKSVLDQIYPALHKLSARGDSKEACDHLARAILQIVIDELQRRQTTIMSESRNEEEFVRSITEYLDEHYAEELSIEELSRLFHISPYYLSRFFKKGTGIAPTKYVLNRRIGEAQKLLMNTDLPIGEIGAMVGIDEIAFFSRQFKKYVGITPTEFRTFHKETAEN